MWNNKNILWWFPVLAGSALGILIYSYLVWNTNIPIDLIGYWFGLSNFATVTIITSSIVLIYLGFLILMLRNKGISQKMKLWAIFGMLAIAISTQFTLSFSQRFRKMNRIETISYQLRSNIHIADGHII